MRNQPRPLHQDRLAALHQLRLLHGALAGHRADGQPVALFADVLELFDSVQVHQQLRAGHPHAQERHQALAAGQELHVLVGVLLQQGQGLAERIGCCVLEGSGLHASASSETEARRAGSRHGPSLLWARPRAQPARARRKEGDFR
jgi:hypothetical protein